jgi:hypothetical protein
VSAKAQLEQIAARQGWRLEWRDTDWKVFGWKLRVLDIFAGRQRIGGASSTYASSSDPNFSSETIAKMIVEALPGAGGVRHGDRLLDSAGGDAGRPRREHHAGRA